MELCASWESTRHLRDVESPKFSMVRSIRVVAAPDAHLTHLQLSSPRKLRTASALRIRRSSEFYFATLISSPVSLIAKALASLVWIPLTCLGLLLCGRASSAYARFFAWLGLFAHFPHILAQVNRAPACAPCSQAAGMPRECGAYGVVLTLTIRRDHGKTLCVKNAGVMLECTSSPVWVFSS